MLLKKINYHGWKNSWLLSHAGLELVALTQVGPRILRFAKKGGPNLLKEFPEERGKTGGTRYRAYGGHRLWVAPEIRPVTYEPDNGPVKFIAAKGSLRLIQPPSPRSGLSKEMDIRPSARGFEISHKLANHSPRSIEAAAWAITMLKPGGKARVSFPPPSGVRGVPMPSAHLVWWRYTRLEDKRLKLKDGFYEMKTARTQWPLKVGSWCPEGKITYRLGGTQFTKTFPAPGGHYPDFGCNVEVFTQGNFMELESLSPLRRLGRGKAIEHLEQWSLGDSDGGQG